MCFQLYNSQAQLNFHRTEYKHKLHALFHNSFPLPKTRLKKVAKMLQAKKTHINIYQFLSKWYWWKQNLPTASHSSLTIYDNDQFVIHRDESSKNKLKLQSQSSLCTFMVLEGHCKILKTYWATFSWLENIFLKSKNYQNIYLKTRNQSSDILQHSQNRSTGDRWLKF